MAKKFPTRPYIRKLGTIECNNIVETTPLIWKDELYRFEVVRRKSFTAKTAQANISWHDVDDSPCLRFIHVRSNASTPLFAEDHTFGFPYVVGDTMHVVTGASKDWGADKLDFFRSKGIPALTDLYAEAADVSIGDCFSISKQLSKAFLAGEFDEIHVAYTNFVSVLSQVPATMQLLPLKKTEPKEAAEGQRRCDTIYEHDPEEVFAAIVPEYLGGILYGALCESRAAEQAARRSAMDSATQNADEMIADLSLKFNRARQAAITQEITEIVAGS